MKALIFSAPKRVEWRDVPYPKLLPFGAILQPIAVSPCTSDVHTVFGGGKPKSENHILGHECVAKIVELGDEVRCFSVGEVVAVPAITPDWRALGIQDGNFTHAGAPFSGHQLGRTMPGVFAEYFSVPDADTTLAKIPKNVTLEQALMCVDMVTTGFTAAENGDIRFGDTVCVLGIGAVGLMAVAGAKLMGAAKIIAVGSRPKTLELAKSYGASDIIDYKTTDVYKRVMELTENEGVDVTIIAGGTDSNFSLAVDITRYGIGRISNVNYFSGEGNLPFPKFSGGRGMAGKTIHTELAKGGRVRIERMLKMVEYNRVDPTPLITNTEIGIDKIPMALQLMADKQQDIIKIMVKL